MKRLSAVLTILLLGLPLARPVLAGDTVYYYSSDTLHSEVVITDASRNVVERTYYAPYGQVLNRGLRDGPAYTGHEEDPESGLVYMQQRYYDPGSGQFLSSDPVATTDDGGSFNRYAYANDDPYRFTDPTGAEGVGFWNNGENFATADLDSGLSPANAEQAAMFTLRTLPGTGEYLALNDYLEHPTWLRAGILLASAVDLGGAAKALGEGGGTAKALTEGGENEAGYLYRGVKADHPNFSSYQNGEIVPGNVNGSVTAAEHNFFGSDADTQARSPFTSWTRNPELASSRAGEGGLVVRLPTGAPPPGASWSWEWSPDRFGEDEVLLRGARSGAEVLP